MAVYEQGKRIAVLAAARTPQVKAFAELASCSAVTLAKHASQEVLSRARLAPSDVSETIFGNVSGPADSANIARVIALQVGVPEDRIAHTVNRNCASGMESIIGASQAIRERGAKFVLAGGTESMSGIPLLCNEDYKRKIMRLARAKSTWARLKTLLSFRPRDLKPINAVMLGLTDPTCGMNMGQTAELLAQDFAISREEQDTFALQSHSRALAAAERCFMSGEIAAFDYNGKRLEQDIGPRSGQTMEKLAKLKPIFERDGTVTPGNSCPLTDGAAAVVLAGEEQVDEPLGYVSAYSIRGCDPRRMGLGPVFATSQLLHETGLRVSDIDLWEINEAFAAQVLACLCAFNSKEFAREHLGRSDALGSVDPDRLNIHGGAIALGHPVGTSGTRIVLTLLRALRERGYQRGVATLCVGGGQGVAMLVETA